jgi:hypothetical protein
MKRYFIFAILLAYSFSIKAQDTIVTRNGETIISKLVEVNPTNVRYKRFDYQDGPLFMLEKQDLKFIVYVNGMKDSFENYVAPPAPVIKFPAIDLTMQTSGKHYYYKERRIGEPDMLAIAGKLNDPKINLMIKKTEEKKLVQNITAIAGIPLFISGFYIYESNRPKRSHRGSTSVSSSSHIQAQKNGEYLMLGAVASELASFYFSIDRRRHAHIVVDAYNKEISKR